MVSERSGDGKMIIGVEKNMEIEEGEASYYQNGDETTFDPDVTMSYIDEKIHDILGQFQKDFEGGVSAENLGAKFGLYGSFLPTCARSPARSQRRTALDVVDGNTTKSPRILDPEATQLSLFASSCSSIPLMHEFGSNANPKGHGSINGRMKGEGRVPLDSTDTPTLNGKQKSEYPPDQRTLKVRLTFGSNNLASGKNDKIYSGLGLDGSPSPSLSDSCRESEWLSHDLRDLSGNSPTSILKIMTSFLLQGTQLLSPLSEELICFTEKEKYSTDGVSKPVHKGKVKGCESRKDVREPLPKNKSDSYEKSDFLESKGHGNAGLLSKQDILENDLPFEKLVTSSMKLPQLSNTQPGPLSLAERSVKAVDSLKASNKVNKGSHVNNVLPKNDIVGTRKDLKKITNKYQEFFGDLDFEEVDNKVALKEVSSVNKLMDSKLEGNGSALVDNRMIKEKSSVCKTGKPFRAEGYLRASSNEKLPSIATGHISDAISSVPAPEKEESWVPCDKCQKWRLLPLGRNARSLPEKWVCSMLDWLPAMNNCTFTEEETTNASRSLCKVSSDPLGVERQLPGQPGADLSVVSSTGVSNSAHNGQILDQTSHSGGKKKQKSKDGSSRLVYGDGEPVQLPKSMKNQQEESKKMDYVNQIFAVDASGNRYVGQSSSSLAEDHANKPHTKTLLESCSVEDAKKSKTRKRRQTDSDSSRSSKKVKPQDGPYNDDNGMSVPSGHLLESGNCLGNKAPSDMPRKDKRTIDGHPKDEFPNHIAATETTYDASFPNHNHDEKSSSQKDKCQGEQGTHPYVGDLLRIGNQSRGKSEGNDRKVKKARPSNSEEKVAITRNTTSETGQQAIKSIGKHKRQEQGSSGTADSSKRDLVAANPFVASTSSSSKVSGLCKIKSGGQDVRCSPVESVSSSPLRVLITEKCALASTKLQGKDDKDGTFVDNCSPKGSLDGASHKVHHSTSVETSVVDPQGKDLGFVSCSKIKEENKYSSDIATLLINDDTSKGTQDTFKNQEYGFISERSSGVKDVGANRVCENKATPGCNVRLDDKLNMKEGIVLERIVQNASNKLFSDVRSGSETSGSGKANSLPPSARSKSYKGAHLPLISGSQKENAVDVLLSEAHGDSSKAGEQNKKIEKQNGSTPSRHSNATMLKVRDQDGSSVRKDSRSQAATNAMKEAKDLKRLADRFKNSGSADSTGMYFEAALKFLYGASLLEAGSRENNKHNDIQYIDIYRSTAKFCEFCAHEYERSKDMVSAALAYKCMEVSYMRVIYTSHGNSNKDRNEVQMALQIVPPGESPASSASDVDNLNNPITVDKVSTSKATTSPQVAGNTGITSRNRSSFKRLLELGQDASAAMDAARKSRATFAVANVKSGDASCSDSISTVKKALDFDFQDVEGLLRLVRIAKDAISR